MKEEYDINHLISNLDFSSGKFQNINGLFLTNHEIEVLDRYNIPYKNCHSLKEITYLLEEMINDMDIVEEELDLVSSSIAERDYYQNTEK